MSVSNPGNSTPQSLVSVYLRISAHRFHFLKFILEGYDNLAVLSSFNIKQGIVRLRTNEDQLKDLFELLTAVAGKLGTNARI